MKSEFFGIEKSVLWHGGGALGTLLGIFVYIFVSFSLHSAIYEAFFYSTPRASRADLAASLSASFTLLARPTPMSLPFMMQTQV